MAAPDDLVPWLLEQIAEDERVARACLTDEVMTWRDEDWAEIGSPSIDHVQRHDPARVLAECEAKRAVIERLTQSGAIHGGDIEISPLAARDILERLSLAFADRPGYQEEWRP